VPVSTAAITRGDMEQTVEITGDLVALNSAALSAKIAGRLAAVNVREGDLVAPGQVVALLDREDANSNLKTADASLESARAKLAQAIANATATKIQVQSAIDQAQATLNSAQAKLAVAKRPSRSQERMVAEHRVNAAKASLDSAEAIYKRDGLLVKEGAIAQADYDVAKAQYLVAQADYQSARDQLGMIDEGGRREDVSNAEAQVEVAKEALRQAQSNTSLNLMRREDINVQKAAVRQAEAAIALAQQQLANTSIRSPLAGQIASRTADPGQVVSPGQALATVVDLHSIYLKGDISEKELARVRVGQSVRVRVDALPGLRDNGVVTEIYPAGSTSSRNFSVRISLPRASRALKPGMFARGEIVTGLAAGVLLIPKDAVDDRKGTQSVFTVGPDSTVRRHFIAVRTENSQFAQVEVPGDLKVGDIVVTQGHQNLQEGTKVAESAGGGSGR
jgi:HlyD family secretion protein